MSVISGYRAYVCWYCIFKQFSENPNKPNSEKTSATIILDLRGNPEYYVGLIILITLPVIIVDLCTFRFSWTVANSLFTLTPQEGFCAPSTDVTLTATYAPDNLQAEVQCQVETALHTSLI